MQLQLEKHEIDRLLRLCEHELAELRVEVRRTSTPGFHDDLVRQRDELSAVILKLRRHLESAAA